MSSGAGGSSSTEGTRLGDGVAGFWLPGQVRMEDEHSSKTTRQGPLVGVWREKALSETALKVLWSRETDCVHLFGVD